ncbi:hypothetical protein [Oceanibium sediminis]|uniref:hypothetical protein n=1 Tax=Oceanibium sediminis TaxID=2026339 RepID=UPI000DD47874|nr:hypothetical protein [Oceanibium sediminis]
MAEHLRRLLPFVLIPLGVVLAFNFYAADVLQTPFGPLVHLEDDNMITLRVAQVMHETGRPYFNPGEPVAANTSLFWPILMSPLFGLLPPEVVPGVLFMLSCVMSVLSATLAASLVRPAVAQVLVFAAVLLSPGFIKYGGSGWEHIPQTLVVTFGFWLILRNSARTSWRDAAGFLAVSLGFAFRLDAAVLVAGVWGLFVLRHGRAHPVRVGAISLFALLLPALYLVLMLRYYGDVVPNTFYLKESGPGEIGQGLRYLATPRLAGLGPVLVAAAALLWLRKPGAKGADLAVSLVLLAYVAAMSLSGGDIFSAGRFFLVVLPVATALVVRAMEGAALQGAVAAAILAGGIATGGAPNWRGPIDTRTAESGPANKMASHVALTQLIADRLSPQDGSIGLHRLGMGYHLPDFHIVDFLGKAEPHIARTAPQRGPKGHNKWDYDHAFATYDIAAAPFPMSEADLLQYEDLPPHNWMYLWIFGRKLLTDPEYVLLSPEALGGSQTDWGLFVRTDLAARMKQ